MECAGGAAEHVLEEETVVLVARGLVAGGADLVLEGNAGEEFGEWEEWVEGVVFFTGVVLGRRLQGGRWR